MHSSSGPLYRPFRVTAENTIVTACVSNKHYPTTVVSAALLIRDVESKRSPVRASIVLHIPLEAYLVLPAYAGGGGGPPPSPLCLHAPSWHPGGLFLTLAARWWWCCLQVILLGLMGLLDSQLWSGRLLSYCEVALLGFRCLGWRWGTQC
jgi:hypothetical protein